MKNNTLKHLLLASLLASPIAHADWTEAWFDNATYDKPDSFSNQQRGFYSAGGFSARYDLKTDYPVTVSVPRLKSGCGGIDGFLGGVSFLDADYLVQKFQNIMQAAPAVAFDMALKTMCKECSETITKLEAMADELNSIQMNECAMSKRLVATVQSGDSNITGAMWNEMTSDRSLRESLERSWQEAQEKVRANDNKPTHDLKVLTDGCPKSVKDLFATGSVIQHATEKVGMGTHADIIRGYVGDVVMVATKDDPIPQAHKISACGGNQKTTLEDMLHGRALAKSTDGTCTKDSSKSVLAIVRTRMESIANKLRAGTVLTTEESQFINATPNVPVYSILRKAVIKGPEAVAVQIDVMAELVAVSYTWLIFNDLYRNTNYMLTQVRESMTSGGTAADAGKKQCDMRLYASAIDKFDGLHAEMLDNKKVLAVAYQQKLNGLLVSLQHNNLHKEDDRTIKQQQALDHNR